MDMKLSSAALQAFQSVSKVHLAGNGQAPRSICTKRCGNGTHSPVGITAVAQNSDLNAEMVGRVPQWETASDSVHQIEIENLGLTHQSSRAPTW